MNSAKLAIKRKPFTLPLNRAKTVNLYAKRTRDLLAKSGIKSVGWEERPIRIVNAITWALEHAKEQGLAPRKNGYVRVQDLLKHPNFVNLDFPTIEKAVKAFRHPYLRLSFSPEILPPGPITAAESSCWWIYLQQHGKYANRTLEEYVDRRVIEPKVASGIMYQVPSQDWPEISVKGIPRGHNPRLTFTTDIMIPHHYEGDKTFIYVDPKKLHADHPIYHTRVIKRRSGNKSQNIFTTTAPRISSDMFDAAIRVAVERYPLILRNPTVVREETRLMENNKKADESEVMKVMQSGMDALRKYGFASVVEQSNLETGFLRPRREVGVEKTKESRDDMKDRRPKVQDELAAAPRIPIPKRPKGSGKDPPPSLSYVPSIPPHMQLARRSPI